MLSRSRIFPLLLLSIIYAPLALSIDKENKVIVTNEKDSNKMNPASIHGANSIIENVPNPPHDDLPKLPGAVVSGANNKINTLKTGAEETIAKPNLVQLQSTETNVTAIVKNTSTNNSSKSTNNVGVVSDKPVNRNATDVNFNHIPNKIDLVESGALRRGFYVFLGLSGAIVIYFFCRSYRLRHGGQPSTKVRKYGVLARRSDMEMRPLELDEEDDDTLFEINNQSPRH